MSPMALLQSLWRSAMERLERGRRALSDFKGRHFGGEIVLWAVRWYCRYGKSYRDLEQMMGERRVSVDHSTIYRWVQRYAPEIEKRLRWHWRRPRAGSWRVDETYVKVRGKWSYLYRAVDKLDNTIDFYLPASLFTSSMRFDRERASRSSRQTTRVSPVRRCESASVRPGRSALVPVTLSVKM